MVRPLYQPRSGAFPQRYERGHAGLWYDKFCNRWSVKSWQLEANDPDSGKLGWINTLAGQPLGQRQQLQEACTRLIQLATRRGGRVLVLRSESRFVTGLGRSHPIENGFAWHPTLGTPYLPGSSIKGMVRAWAKQEDPQADTAMLDRIFGTAGKAGALSFLDAVPTEPVRVEADVITPHYAGWSPQDPPGDWRSPVPVPFLATAAGMPLLFALIPCGILEPSDLERVMGWLEDALAWAGAGAKTSVGYGRMVADQEATSQRVEEVRKEQAAREAEIARAERLATLDPLERELEEIAATETNLAPYRTWIKAVQSGRWSEQKEIEKRVLQMITNAMKGAGVWKEAPTKKRPSRDNNYKNTLQVKELLAKNQDASG
jgi:CRISPR-associated protein Cmr6